MKNSQPKIKQYQIIEHQCKLSPEGCKKKCDSYLISLDIPNPTNQDILNKIYGHFKSSLSYGEFCTLETKKEYIKVAYLCAGSPLTIVQNWATTEITFL